MNSKIQDSIRDENVQVLFKSNTPVSLENTSREYLDSIVVEIFMRIDARSYSSADVLILSYEVAEVGDLWEASIEFVAKESGSYQLSFMNESDEFVSCEYVMFAQE